MPMLNATNVTLETIIGVVVAGQVANVALLWKFWTIIHHDFMPRSECVLRTDAAHEQLEAVQDEGRASDRATEKREAASQERIDELVRAIAARAAETILRDREILSKIDTLIARK